MKFLYGPSKNFHRTSAFLYNSYLGRPPRKFFASMEALLVKVFATALALSLVMTRPDAVKTQFDLATDKAEVMKILGDGCDAIKKSFDIENIDLDGLIDTVMIDKQATAGEIAGFKGIKFDDLHLAYKQLCKHEKIDHEVIDLDAVIEFYNRAAADLPDHNRLKGLKLPGMTTVFDGAGQKFAELYEPDSRRHWVPLTEIPEYMQKAFVAAEDKRFYDHKGVDVRSVTRAFMNTMGGDKRQGGSTITQQVAKNLLVGDSITFERKIREVIVANRIEKTLTKPEILEIYLNSIYLGRSSWGVDVAARSYFGKPVKDLTLTESAFIAGLTKGPAYYNPDKYRDRAKERLAYVLTRMKDDNFISAQQETDAEAARLNFVAFSRPRREIGFHLVDEVSREARSVAKISSLTTQSYEVRSTINPGLQRAAETALQEGLAQYEMSTGRVEFRAPEANLADAIRKIESDPKTDRSRASWQIALDQLKLPLYDVHWSPAVVVERRNIQGSESIRVGLKDGRILPLSTYSSRARSRLNPYDVIYVKVIEGTTRQVLVNGRYQQQTSGTRVDMRVRPTVQGTVVVMDNKTGRILAMVGGFSYPLSQLNRVTQARRQPGSSFKPMTYLAALNSGLQPNTLVDDAPITYPPIGGTTRYTRPEDYWSPHNYDGGSSGTLTIRRALEMSKNLVTARLLDGGVKNEPSESLDEICRLAIEAGVYPKCERYYPFVLGAQPVRSIDLAGFYGAVANEGKRPTPHVIERITKDGQEIYKADESLRRLGSIDPAAMFQIRTFLQGVVARGTAARMSALSNYVGAKTGTSDEFNDAWIAGFTNDITVVVWVGYDNAKGKRTLGNGQAGGRVALPIFEQIVKASWQGYAPQTPLPRPSQEASRHLVALPIDVNSGQRLDGGGGGFGWGRERFDVRGAGGTRYANVSGGFMEYFRVDDRGSMIDTQDRLSGRGTIYSGDSDSPFSTFQSLFGGGPPQGPNGFGYPNSYQSPGPSRDPFFAPRDAGPPPPGYRGGPPPVSSYRRYNPSERQGF
jgi:penicillin-binding protein 1A